MTDTPRPATGGALAAWLHGSLAPIFPAVLRGGPSPQTGYLWKQHNFSNFLFRMKFAAAQSNPAGSKTNNQS